MDEAGRTLALYLLFEAAYLTCREAKKLTCFCTIHFFSNEALDDVKTVDFLL
jgi:hypothetical protein